MKKNKSEEKVALFIQQHQLLNARTRVIVGLSGGPDSVCLALMLHRLGYEVIAAHANFHLRGEESMRDEKFVETLCLQYGIAYRKADFDTVAYAKEKKVSIEMAARDLRYAWFGELCTQEGFDCVAVAHNADDNAETFFLNLLRGTGTRGLRGMGDRGLVVRPLLGISREQIRIWMEQRGLSWREDSSNASSAYKRNRLRHEVIPVLKEMNPSLLQSLGRTMEHIRQTDDIAEDYFLKARQTVCSGSMISIRALLALEHPRYVLFRLTEPVGLTETALDNLWDLLEAGRQVGGRVFYGNGGCVRGLPKWRLEIILDKTC